MTIRYRIFYKKTFELRYTALLDMQKIWERYLRRSKIPIAYSKGFHPKPKLTQAAPLPLGFLSDDEIIDFWIDEEDIDLSFIQRSLKDCNQPGIIIKNITEVDLKQPALPTLVTSSNYDVEFLIDIPETKLEQSVSEFINSESILRNRRNKDYDLRKLVHSLRIISTVNPSMPILKMELTALPGATGRPEEVILQLGFDPFITRITRTKTIIKP